MPGVAYFNVTNHVEGQAYSWDIASLFGTRDANYSDPSDPFKIKVNTSGNVGNFTVTVVSTNACGYSAESELSLNVNKDDFPYDPVETGNIFENYSYTLLDALLTDGSNGLAWYGGHDAIQWMYNGVNVTDPNSRLRTVTGLPSGLLNSTSFYVTVTNNSTGCKTRKTGSSLGIMRSVSAGAQSASASASPRSASANAGEMLISPNPTSSSLQVTLPEDDTPASITIYSLTGSIVKQLSNMAAPIEVNVSDLSTGTYFVVANQNGHNYAKKFIKQ